MEHMSRPMIEGNISIQLRISDIRRSWKEEVKAAGEGSEKKKERGHCFVIKKKLIDAGSRSEPFSRGMSFCLYASRSGANKKSPVSVDWHYMTLGNHCQKAS
ncbi:hypothetical protein EYF80_016801 [Liparis tanakae]|uniref:Uncharacterized protein n=1 Tax=Liparis tanakae TaxID=230148 RepID=A0A4Z2I5G3_9TELE|nr:hypothetical protein EYF80_016801 [Liparis tanakae]